MRSTPVVQHIPVVKHDLRQALQDPAAGAVYVSWEAFVTCSEASVAAVARACEALPHLQPLVLDRPASVDPRQRFSDARIVLPAGVFLPKSDADKAVVYAPFWVECRMGEQIFAEKGHLKGDDILRWVTAVTSSMCVAHRRYCTLAGAWQVAVTDDRAQLRAIKAAKAAMLSMTLSTVNAVALDPASNFDAWIYFDWSLLEAHPDDLSVQCCEALRAADTLQSGEIQIPHLGKRRELVCIQWQAYQQGCFRDLERIVATLLALLQNRRVSTTEVAWLLREDGARLKAGLKPHLSHLSQPIADAFSAIADYVADFARWMRNTHRWDGDRTTVDCWHVQQFPVLVEQLKSVLVQQQLSKTGHASPHWSLAAQSLVIKMQHAEQARMQKLAAQGRRDAKRRLRVRAKQLRRQLTTDEQAIRMMEVDSKMRKLAQKWAKQTRHAAKFATFTRWSAETLSKWCEEAIVAFEREEIRTAVRLKRGMANPNPYRVERARTLYNVLVKIRPEVLRVFLAKATEAETASEEAKQPVEKDAPAGEDDASEENARAGGHIEAWMQLLTIPRECRQLFVKTAACCLGKMVRRFQTLPSILLQGLAAAETQMNNRVVSSLLTGERRSAQQANFAAQILSTSSFFHEIGHEVGKAAQIPSARWRNLCRLVLAEALYEACMRDKSQRDHALNFCAARIQALFRGVRTRAWLREIWRQADEILASEMSAAQHAQQDEIYSRAQSHEVVDGLDAAPEVSGAGRPPRHITLSWQCSRCTSKLHALDAFLVISMSGLEQTEVRVVHRKLRARALLLSVRQSFTGLHAEQKNGSQVVVVDLDAAAAPEARKAKRLRVPSDEIAADRGAVVAELDLQVTGLEAAAEYDVQIRIAPALVDLLVGIAHQACGRAADVTVDRGLLTSPLQLLNCRTLSSAVPLRVEFSAEIASKEHQQEDVLVTSSSAANRARVRCTVSWDDWRSVEGCTMYTVHRSQQFPQQHTFVSVWQLVYEGGSTRCDDVLPDAIVETARSRSTLLTYRVTAHTETVSTIQDVWNLSRALTEVLSSDELIGHSFLSFGDLANGDEDQDETQPYEQASLEDMMQSLAEATPLTQFA